MEPHQSESADTSIGRRRVLRRAGAVVVGAAAAGAASAVAAGPAQAAAGDPVTQGATNNAGITSTILTATNLSAPTLALANAATQTNGGLAEAGGALRLVPSGDRISPDAPVGSMSFSSDGHLWYTSDEQSTAWVYSTWNANLLVPITPQRVIDTRVLAQRANIVTPGAVDANGRLRPNMDIKINLSTYSAGSYAVFGNLTAVQPLSDGFATLWSTGAAVRPVVSAINFTDKMYALSNSFVVAVGFDEVGGQVYDTISVRVSTPTHLIIDVSAFQAPDWENIDAQFMPFSTAGASADRAPTGAPRRAFSRNRQTS